jgi:hypothetical protein
MKNWSKAKEELGSVNTKPLEPQIELSILTKKTE